jgi:hypothetical protein
MEVPNTRLLFCGPSGRKILRHAHVFLNNTRHGGTCLQSKASLRSRPDDGVTFLGPFVNDLNSPCLFQQDQLCYYKTVGVAPQVAHRGAKRSCLRLGLLSVLLHDAQRYAKLLYILLSQRYIHLYVFGIGKRCPRSKASDINAGKIVPCVLDNVEFKLRSSYSIRPADEWKRTNAVVVDFLDPINT